MKPFILLTSIFISTTLSYNSHAENPSQEILIKTLNNPWAIEYIVDQNIFIITEKSGQLISFNPSKKAIKKIKGIPSIKTKGQGGLLDIKASPHFKDDFTLYFTYAKQISKKKWSTTLAKAKFKNHTLSDWTDMLVTLSESDSGHHFGSRIAFDQNNHLFFSIGDRGERKSAQDLKTHSGKILRLHLDGSVPKDNPFIDHPNAQPEIYSYGHRNPQGLAYDRQRDILFAIEHGPRGGDEINQIQAGKNYGWPIISYGKEYWGPISVGEGTHKKGFEQPIKQFTPSIAPSSLMVYHHPHAPDWNGKLISGALAMTHINIITLNESLEVSNETRWFDDQNERVRDLTQLPNGDIIYITDSGKVIKITRQNFYPLD